MILHHLKVSAWRSILSEVSLGPFSESLNVIHAPNGTGKSSMFEALRLGIFDVHNVTGQAIQDIQPWGRALSPRVQIEFTHSGATYRLTKQFLDGAFSRLERLEDSTFKLFMQGRRADDFVRRLFSDNPPGRGLSSVKNWGLAQVLWAPQGNLELGKLTGDVVRDVQSALRAEVTTVGGGPIEREIENRYSSYFTSTGKLKSGKDAPLLAQYQGQLEEARAEEQKARDEYEGFEVAIRKVEDLRAARQQARHDEAELRKEVEKARESLRTFERLRAEIENKEEKAKAAEAEYHALKERVDHIARAERELKESSAEIEELTKEVAAAEREVAERRRQFSEAQAALEEAQKERRRVEQLSKELKLAQQLSDASKQRRDLKKRLNDANELEKKLTAARTARAEIVAPDRTRLEAVRRAIKKRDAARTKIESSLICLEVVPAKALDIEAIQAEESGTKRGTPGEPLEFRGAPHVVVAIQGVARLRASGPVGDVDALRSEVQEADAQIEKLTRPFGTDDPDRLQALADAADDKDHEIELLNAQLDSLVEDGDLDGLRAEITTHEAVISNILEQIPKWRKSPPAPEQLVSDYEDAKRRCDEEIADATDARQKASQALSDAEKRRDVTRARLETRQQNQEKTKERLADLTRDGMSAAQRQNKLKQVAMEWDAAKGPLLELREQLAELPEDPAADLERLQKQLDALEAEAVRAREEEKEAEGRLRALEEKGPYSAWVQARERVVRLEYLVEAEQRRADAIRLLHETVRALRTETLAAVSEPVEVAATRMLERIAGPHIGRVHLDETLAPQAVHPVRAPDTVGLANLSGGESEQLHLVCRLALAQVLAADQRQLVVLDDVLSATDASRFVRILRILEELTGQLQIVILTCHPERYRPLDQAMYFDLEELLKESS